MQPDTVNRLVLALTPYLTRCARARRGCLESSDARQIAILTAIVVLTRLLAHPPDWLSESMLADPLGSPAKLLRGYLRACIQHALTKAAIAQGPPPPDPVADTRLDPYEPVIETRLVVADLVRRLPAVERDVVRMKFGLINGRPRSHREIASTLGITRAHSRKLLQRALVTLREIA